MLDIGVQHTAGAAYMIVFVSNLIIESFFPAAA